MNSTLRKYSGLTPSFLDIMIKITFLLLAMTACSELNGASRETFSEYTCYYNGNRYLFKISHDQQARCPKWNPDQDENPPLSASRALHKAKDFISTIKTREGESWKIDELGLIDDGGWLWRARFLCDFRGTGSAPIYMDCFVLMDGTVIQPKVSKGK